MARKRGNTLKGDREVKEKFYGLRVNGKERKGKGRRMIRRGAEKRCEGDRRR